MVSDLILVVEGSTELSVIDFEGPMVSVLMLVVEGVARVVFHVFRVSVNHGSLLLPPVSVLILVVEGKIKVVFHVSLVSVYHESVMLPRI